MSMSLPIHMTAGYASASQIARVVTEAWVGSNLYCPSCGNALRACPANTKTKDFDCSHCGEPFQLKSMTKPFKGVLLGAEYSTTLKSVNRGLHPSLILLRYARPSMTVLDVQIVHRACITSSCIIPRKPLSATARRGGWQGCNIALDQIPATAKADMVLDGMMQPQPLVLQRWQSIQKLLKQDAVARGWTADVLRIVERLGTQFTLADVYVYESELSELHPENNNVQAKIRQQLQVLRDMGLILFSGRGLYRRATPTEKPGISGDVDWRHVQNERTRSSAVTEMRKP